ncbi:MAG: rod shape-determining protein MreD [Sandaracinaceae bacterium]
MRSVAYVVLGLLLLVSQAAVGVLFPLNDWAPNLVLPIVIYLGVANDIPVVRGAALSFVLGYLLDSFCGSPMGLATFVMVASFLIARGAGLNLFMRGPLLQSVITFAFALAAGGAVIALRAIFEPPAPFPLESVTDTVVALVLGAAVTGAFASPLFVLIRRIDALLVRGREEVAPS